MQLEPNMKTLHCFEGFLILQERFSLPTPPARLADAAAAAGETAATSSKDYEKALGGLAAAAGDLQDAGFDESDEVFLEHGSHTEL